MNATNPFARNLAILGLSISSILQAATVYYVSPNGNDKLNNGLSVGAPFATIQKAADLMNGGDTCQILAGTYRETVKVKNTTAAQLTFQAYLNHIVTISGADPVTGWLPDNSTANPNDYYVPGPALTREVWSGIPGKTVSSIPLDTPPSISDTLPNFETPTNWSINYGTRVRGIFTAPASGAYTFWIAGDDNCELWLSSDSSSAGKMKIASVNTWTNPREWTREPGQKSSPVTLVQGQRYYIEALQKEDAGGDNLAVGWARPTQSTAAPSEIMPGSVFMLGEGNQVFKNGEMKPEARWPNAGASFPWQDSSLDHPFPYSQLGNWSYVDSATYIQTLDFGGSIGIKPVASFTDSSLPSTQLLDGTFRGDNYWQGARIHIMQGDGWIMKNPQVVSYTHSSKTILTDSTYVPNPSNPTEIGAYTIRPGNEYYLTGKKAEMDSEGEWFYEPEKTTPVAHSGRLYLYSVTPPAGVEIKKRPYGMDLSNTSYVTLKNLDFFACTIKTSSGSSMTTNCTLDGLSMKYLNHNRLESGDNGLVLGTNCVLRNSELGYSSSRLVLMQGKNVRLINNFLHDMCYMPTFGEGITGSEFGADSNSAYDNVISHNTIRSAGRGLIGYPGRSSLVQYNDISDGMKMCTDGALLYWTKDGGNSTIRYNLIHDSTGPVGHTGGGIRGLYMDNQNSGWIVHHNIIWDVKGYAMQINAPSCYNMIFNNTMWNCESGALVNHFWAEGPTGSHIYNNILNTDPTGNMSLWNMTDIRFNRTKASDPGFADISNPNLPIPDFRLAGGADEALDKGTFIPWVTNIAPSTSVGAPDLGALEAGGDDWTSQAGAKLVSPSPDPSNLTPPTMPYANQLKNGGFESGKLLFTGTIPPSSPPPDFFWIKSSGSNVGLIRSDAWSDNHLHSSYFGLQFGGRADGQPSEVSQKVEGLESDRRYKFYCCIQNTDPASVVKIGVRSYGYADVEVTVPVTGTWRNQIATATPTIFEVPFITGTTSTEATVYVKVTRSSTAQVVSATPPSLSNSAPGLAILSNSSSSTNYWGTAYPSTGVYVDDLAVIRTQDAVPISSKSPIVQYSFNQTTGPTAKDSGISGMDGSILSTSPLWQSGGKFGNALGFDGVDDYLTTPSFTTPSAVTAACWAKSDTLTWSGYGCLVSKRPSFIIHPEKGSKALTWVVYKLGASPNPNSDWALVSWTPGPTFNITDWHHYAGVFDPIAQTASLYVDGVLEKSVATTISINTENGPLYVGRDDYTNYDIARNFKGLMDDTRIYDRALTAAEIKELAAPDTSRLLHLALDEIPGLNKAWDSSVAATPGELKNIVTSTAWGSGIVNGALTFDGQDDHVLTPDITTPSALTVSCWAKSNTSTWSGYGCLVSKRPSFVLHPERGSKNISWGVYKSGASPPTANMALAQWTATPEFDITKWHHYAGVFNPTTQKAELYVDGVVVRSIATAISINVETGPVYIGRDRTPTYDAMRNFDGQIDDVRIYSRALSWSEILEISELNNSPPYY